MAKRIPRIGVGGPVGSGKTALIECLVPRLMADGYKVIVVTNDIVTVEDALHVKRTLAGILEPERILGVETGACPHTAVREDPTMNLAFLEEMEAHFIYVIDVAAGDKIPRKNGPGITQSDLLVINKVDLAPHVGASLEVMARDSQKMRGAKPFLFTNCMTRAGIDEVVILIKREVLFEEVERQARE